MTQNRVAVALEKYEKQIPADNVYFFKKYLQEASDDCMDEFMSLPIKGKTKTLLFSIFLGGIAVDRFYIGDIGIGAIKLILRLLVALLSGTALLGSILSLISAIWSIADIFITYKIAKKINYDSINVYIEHPQKNDGKLYTLSEINRDLRSQNLEYKVYISKGGEQVWIESLSTLQDITDFMFMMELDASYFVKTPYGFSMPDEKYKEVCKLMMGENAYAEMEEAWDEYHIHFNSDYYVTDGRLSASKTVLTMSNGDDIFALTITVNYTDFGTTEVKLPNSTEV